MRIIVGHFSTYNVGLLGLSRNDYISHYFKISGRIKKHQRNIFATDFLYDSLSGIIQAEPNQCGPNYDLSN